MGYYEPVPVSEGTDAARAGQGSCNAKARNPSRSIHMDFSFIFRPIFLSPPEWKAVVTEQSSLHRGSSLTLHALPTACVWEAFAISGAGSQVCRAAKGDSAHAELGRGNLETSAAPGKNWSGSTQRHLGESPLEITSCSPVHIKGENKFLQKGAESGNLPKSKALEEYEGMRILRYLS